MLVDHLLELDLLVTDLVMPSLCGVSLVRTIRQLGGEHELPIVVVSGALEPERVDPVHEPPLAPGRGPLRRRPEGAAERGAAGGSRAEREGERGGPESAAHRASMSPRNGLK